MRFKFIVVSVLLLIGAYSFFWFKMADQAKTTTLEWIENSEQRLGGIKTFVGDVSVSGFPYKIAVEATSLDVLLPAGRLGAQPVNVNVPEIAAVYQPWKPNHVVIVTDYFDAAVGDMQSPARSFSFDKVMASVIVDLASTQLNNLSIAVDYIGWNGDGQSDDAPRSKVEKAEFHIRRNTGEAPDPQSYDLPVNRAVYFKGENAVINELSATILGSHADAFKVEALLHANEQPDFTREGLSAWRDDGGTVSIRTFEYGTSENGISLSGDVTLDENLKPLGAFDATVSGMAAMFKTLSENEELPQLTRMLLAGQAENNSLPEDVPLSISMQNGQLYLGPIMLMELPAVLD